MADEIATSAKLLADVAPDLIVFHCTDTSMTQGPQGEGRILDIIQDAAGGKALATSRLVLEALQALGLRRLLLLSPYKSNQAVIDYLTATGFAVVHDVALGLKSLEFAAVTPANGRSSRANTTVSTPMAFSSVAPTPRRSRQSRRSRTSLASRSSTATKRCCGAASNGSSRRLRHCHRCRGSAACCSVWMGKNRSEGSSP